MTGISAFYTFIDLVPLEIVSTQKTEEGGDMPDTTQKKQKKTGFAHLFRLSHWLLSAGMLFLIFTGFGIHTTSMPSWSVIEHYPSFYPGFRAIHWHKVIGIIFAPATIISAVIFFRRIKRMKLSNLRRIASILLLGSAVVCVFTSLGLIYTNIPAWIYHFCRFLHAVCGMIIAPIALLTHIYLALFRFFPMLVPSFAPFRQSRWPQVVWLLVGLVISWAIFTRFISYHSESSVLTALKVAESVSEAKQIDSLQWASAEPLKAQLVNGVGFDYGVTDATLQALYNNEYLYVKYQWTDYAYDRIYRPWLKTETGWVQLNPGGSDEVIYNEDKAAFVFPIDKDTEFQRYGCAVYCHNNEKTGRGQHWTAPDNPVDIWHWKSVRMDPMGYIDDKYWLGTDGKITIDQEFRHGDPGKGGHGNNRVKGVSNPIMLPASVDAIFMGAMIQSKAEIYTEEAAKKFPVGTTVPGVVLDYQVEGDRADVRCHSNYDYENNRWILRIMRKLDTGSPYDVIFKPGQEYDFAVAAFDHNANRHSLNHQVYRLNLAQ